MLEPNSYVAFDLYFFNCSFHACSFFFCNWPEYFVTINIKYLVPIQDTKMQFFYSALVSISQGLHLSQVRVSIILRVYQLLCRSSLKYSELVSIPLVCTFFPFLLSPLCGLSFLISFNFKLGRFGSLVAEPSTP